jgi:hypothetical protein
MVWILKDFAYRDTLFFLLFIISQPLSAQEGVYQISWTDNGKEINEIDRKLITREYLKFEGAVYDNEYLIPRFSRTIRLKEYSTDKFEIVNLKFEPVPDSLLHNLFLPEDIPMFESRAAVHRGGTELYLNLSIDALQRNASNGNPERLMEFELVRVPGISAGKMQTKAISKSAGSSILATGDWFKFKVNKTGIYKLTYEDILGMGLPNPENVSLYGHGGKQLSYSNADKRPVDLPEIPIYMNKGSDGVFGGGDYILFYAEGPVVWDTLDSRFRQMLHLYSGSIYYFITTSHGPAHEIETIDNSGLSANVSVDSYNDYAYYEKERYNLIRSGRNWYSLQFDEAEFDTTFRFPNIIPGSKMYIDAVIAGRSEFNRSTFLKVNSTIVDTIVTLPVSYKYSYNQYASDGKFKHSMINPGSEINIGLKFSQGQISDEAYLDYITVNARCQLRKDNEVLFFRDLNSVGENSIANFIINAVSGTTQVWDVTDITNITDLKGQQSGSTFEFIAPADKLRQYVLLDVNYDYPRPVIDKSKSGVGPVENQNIRALPVVNYLIIAQDVFYAQAERLAEYHRQNSNLTVQIVSPEQIYNEFSSGTPDVSAIRDFIRQHYQKSTPDDSLRYVLLFGDGSYNNRSYREGNTNFILTYQSFNSLSPTASYAADDFYGLLDDDEGGVVIGSPRIDIEGKLDIGIGRLPVRSINGDDEEARVVIDKILNYNDESNFDWRRVLTFVGDDQQDEGGSSDGTVHMRHADEMTTIIGNKYPGFEFKKIYLDAYEQIKSSTGAFYPAAKEDLMNSFKKGTLIFCYFGHGSENQLTGERVLQKTDVNSMKNKFLPLFITATCQFSRYDDVAMEVQTGEISAKTTAGEEALLNPDGGAIGLFSTTRVVYSSQNEALAIQLFNCIFDKDSNGKRLRLGDISRKSKNGLNDQINKLSFALLGDPAMLLAYPEFNVVTDSLNGVSVTENSDTLEAFSYVTVSGHVAYDDGSMISDFNGLVYPRVYDKKVKVVTLGNDEMDPFQYTDQKNLIYKGKASVQEGLFNFSFVVPKDISYSIGNGKISYYATNSNIDAKGQYTDMFVGGTNENANIDNQGPEIQLYMNDERFKDGGMTNRDPYLLAKLYDENGINTTGIGIGHDIVAAVDFEDYKSLILNDFYESDADDFRSGKVFYQLSDLGEGEHTLILKAWDVYNNSSDAIIGFVVNESDGLILEKILNYPNPASEITTFQYTHNAPDEVHQILLEIFDLSGRLITSISRNLYESGFVSEPISWNLRNSSGSNLGAGLYPYRLTVTTSLGKSYINQKLIIIR